LVSLLDTPLKVHAESAEMAKLERQTENEFERQRMEQRMKKREKKCRGKKRQI
jgi:hypothetical protein